MNVYIYIYIFFARLAYCPFIINDRDVERVEWVEHKLISIE